MSSVASELRPGFRRPSGDVERWFGGRWDTQSCARSETFGFETRLRVLRDDGFVVIMIKGPLGRICSCADESENGCDGR